MVEAKSLILNNFYSTTSSNGIKSPNQSKNVHEIDEADGKVSRLSDALKDQMNANYNRQGYIVNNNQIGNLTKIEIPKEEPESPLVISHKRRRIQQ